MRDHEVGPPLLTMVEAAVRLGMSTGTLYNLLRRGAIPPGVAIRIGHSVRWDRDRLEAWLAAGGDLSAEAASVPAVPDTALAR